MKEKRKTIKFNIIDYKKGNRSVITERGDKVIILTTDAPGQFSVQGSIEYEKTSEVYSWMPDGTPKGPKNPNLALRLGEQFEDGDIINIYQRYNRRSTCIFKDFKDEETIRCYAVRSFGFFSDVAVSITPGVFREIQINNKSDYIEKANKKYRNEFINQLVKFQGLRWDSTKKVIYSPYKLGDIIVSTNENGKPKYISAYKGIIKTSMIPIFYLSDIYLELEDKPTVNKDTLVIEGTINALDMVSRTRLATEDEKRKFLSFVHKVGLKSKSKPRVYLSMGVKYLMKKNGGTWSEKILDYGRNIKGAYKFYSSEGNLYNYCIPITDGTKHLIGTDKECPNKYK